MLAIREHQRNRVQETDFVEFLHAQQLAGLGLDGPGVGREGRGRVIHVRSVGRTVSWQERGSKKGQSFSFKSIKRDGVRTPELLLEFLGPRTPPETRPPPSRSGSRRNALRPRAPCAA